MARPAYESRAPRARRAREVSYFRFPIALKFAALIAALVVAAMAWQTYTATRAAGERLEEETNESGVTLATVLAAMVGARATADAGGGEALQAALKGLSAAPGAEEVLNIVVYDRNGAAVATAKGESLFHVTRGTPITDHQAATAGVAINEFDYEGIPVRGFAKPLPGDESAKRVEVYLSAARIADSRKKLAEAMTRVSVTACLLAAAGAFLLARFLTRPIRVLVKDMKQVSQGDLHHQSKVNSSDELGDLARAFNAMTSSLEAAQDAKIAQRALEHELSLATGIQARLLPTAIPEIKGLDISAYYLSAREVGGDYYDFLPRRRRRP